MLIVTNNPKVKKHYESRYEIRFMEGTYGQVLREVRDLVHQGHRLMTHPLSGSVKPDETPYKSVAVSRLPGKLDINSLEIIESAIATYEKFINQALIRVQENYTESILADFIEVDFTLMQSALN